MGRIFRHTIAAEFLVMGVISGVPLTAAAEDVTALRVVVHVVDYASVPRYRMIGVQKMVAGLYKKIGVAMTFEPGPLPPTSDPGVLDLQVSFLSQEMTEEKCRNDGLSDQIFGSAVRAARRAYVFYQRAMDLQFETDSLPAVVLATVLAHELGHLLLPEHSHSPEGLMRARWEGTMKTVPQFNRHQAMLIRERLKPPAEMVAR